MTDQHRSDNLDDLSYNPSPIATLPIWRFLTVSGLYQRKLSTLQPLPQRMPLEVAPTRRPISRPDPFPDPIPGPLPDPPPGRLEGGASASAAFPLLSREELRLDVDGRYPQLVVSGTIFHGFGTRMHWIAELVKIGNYQWSGFIGYKNGTASSLPHTNVTVQATPSWYPNQRKVTVTFSGGGAPASTRTYAYKSAYFHPVELEFDAVDGTTAVTSMNTCDHPNRPASLRCQHLTIEKVYRRTGFDVRKSGGDSVVPLSGAGTNARWSDMEMHDAMQTYWSRFANRPQWALWVMFASLHEQGTSLGGIMFDDIGPNHRQGTSIFNDAFIAQPPAGDPNPTAWVTRMRFWTACHEMGHAFNLAHSWQKARGTQWIPLSNELEARSFMNYPFRVAGGQSSFFSDFEYRFSDQELLFMRHAPARFVQMGNADWFDHHGFEQVETSPEPKFRLQLRVNRPRPAFEFLEPVVLELKLTNISTDIQLVDRQVLEDHDEMTVILKKTGRPARQWVPYARYCHSAQKQALASGESLYGSLFVAAGRNGWDLAEPGVYSIQMALHGLGEDLISEPLAIRVAPPQGYDEEYLAQDFFTDDIGRILTFDGSQAIAGGNDVLREVTRKLKKRRVAVHAMVALGNPYTRDFKQLTLPEGAASVAAAVGDGGGFKVTRAKLTQARKDLEGALLRDTDTAAETLGHIDFKYYVDELAAFLADKGDTEGATKSLDDLLKTLSARKVLKSVLSGIEKQRNAYNK